LGQVTRSIGLLLVFSLAATVGQVPRNSSGAELNKRPNILIIVTDDQRSGLSVMPETRRLLKRRGTWFKDAFVTTPLCCPSRASIFTGRYTHNHHVFGNQGEGINLVQRSTLQYYLQKAGYETALFGKYLNKWDITRPPPYFDLYSFTVGDAYSKNEWNVHGTIKTVSRYNTTYISHKASYFIRHAGANNPPWFLYLAPAAPHTPFTPSTKYAHARVAPWEGNSAVFEGDRSDKPPWVQSESHGIRFGRRIRKEQFRTLMSVDDLVSNVFRTLREVRQASNTLVFFISDNGFMWAEHGLYGKAKPYEPSIKVPFLVRWPGHLLEDATDKRIVANIDIAPTVLQATGITPNPAYPIDGRTLLGASSLRRRLLTENSPNPNLSDSPQGIWASTRTDSYKYTEYYEADGVTVAFREYYDLERDPFELHNLLGDGNSSNDPDVAALSAQLAHDRACEGTVGPNSCP
jgi:arylsulfatase A-like enzyme